MHSVLANFIESSSEPILEEAIAFARSLAGGADLDVTELRDHIPQILTAIVADLRTEQTRAEEIEKSEGRAPQPAGGPQTAAATHALHRAQSGYSISGLVSEYRALRASVLRLLADAPGDAAPDLAEVTRFNEAIDEAIAESVAYYADEVERWRNVFLGVLGHELRNPLNAIVLSSELIARMSSGTAIAPLADRLRKNGLHMGKLLDKLLMYNRAQLGVGIHVETSDVDLADEIRQEVEVLKTSLPDARIVLNAPESVPGHVDGARMREVVSNLVINAHKYGTPGSEISVDLRETENATELAVSNYGRPLKPEDIDRLFDPLRRAAISRDTAAEQASLGLGLFIVRQIAQAHGGTVAAGSAEGRTTFSVHLPHGSA